MPSLLAPNVDICGEECGSAAMGLANVCGAVDGANALASGSRVCNTVLGFSKLATLFWEALTILCWAKG